MGNWYSNIVSQWLYAVYVFHGYNTDVFMLCFYENLATICMHPYFVTQEKLGTKRPVLAFYLLIPRSHECIFGY